MTILYGSENGNLQHIFQYILIDKLVLSWVKITLNLNGIFFLL